MQRSKLLLGSLVTVGVLGFGAAAVALDGGAGDTGSPSDATTTTTIVDSTTTTSTTAAPTTTIAPAPTEEPTSAPEPEAGDGGVARSTDGCDGGTYANHGDYVSSVARSSDRAPGDVPAAAQSDCGKPVTAIGGDATDPPAVPDTDAPVSGAPTAPGNNGNGNGNGKGVGRTK
jgi:hypothetical protein